MEITQNDLIQKLSEVEEQRGRDLAKFQIRAKSVEAHEVAERELAAEQVKVEGGVGDREKHNRKVEIRISERTQRSCAITCSSRVCGTGGNEACEGTSTEGSGGYSTSKFDKKKG